MLSQILAATALPVLEKPGLDKSNLIVEPAVESRAFPHRRWPEHSTAETPVYNPRGWDLRIFGAVSDELKFTWQDLQQLPVAEALFDPGLTTVSRGARHWQGFDASSLLALSGVRGDADWLVVHSEGGYSRVLELDRFFEGSGVLATRVDGTLLSSRSGGPVRLILPHFEARYSAQWVRGLELRTDLP